MVRYIIYMVILNLNDSLNIKKDKINSKNEISLTFLFFLYAFLVNTKEHNEPKRNSQSLVGRR